jgi:hypothetical protein
MRRPQNDHIQLGAFEPQLMRRAMRTFVELDR